MNRKAIATISGIPIASGDVLEHKIRDAWTSILVLATRSEAIDAGSRVRNGNGAYRIRSALFVILTSAHFPQKLAAPTRPEIPGLKAKVSGPDSTTYVFRKSKAKTAKPSRFSF